MTPHLVQERTARRIESYAERHFAGKYIRLGIRFKKQFCYIDAYTEPVVPRRWPPGRMDQSSRNTRGTHRTTAQLPYASVSSALFRRRGALVLCDVRLQRREVRVDHLALRRLRGHAR